MKGELTIGSLIAFNAYLGQLYGPIQRFAEVNVTVQNAVTNIERIFEVLDIEPDVKNVEKPLLIDTCKGDIRFEKVMFTYETELPVPKNQKDGYDPDIVEKQKPPKSFYWVPASAKPEQLPTTTESRIALKTLAFMPTWASNRAGWT